MSFSAGQRVVCVEEREEFIAFNGRRRPAGKGIARPLPGAEYLISAVQDFGPGAGLCLYFAGLSFAWEAGAFEPVERTPHPPREEARGLLPQGEKGGAS
jgi:hypothetical protein